MFSQSMWKSNEKDNGAETRIYGIFARESFRVPTARP